MPVSPLAYARVFAALAVGGSATVPAPVPLDRVAMVALPAVPAQPAPTVRDMLAARIQALGEGFDGHVGIAVRDIETGWTTSFNGEDRFPQQSVRKLWVAVAVLAAIDRGELSPSDPVTVRKEDLSVFHQPIRQRVGEHGFTTSVDALLAGAMIDSDNAANDALVRTVGGPWAVQIAVVDRNIEGVRFGPGEKEMQSRAAGLEWRPEYSFGRVFWDDREALDPKVRRAALEGYLADPPDAATPLGIVDALDRLQRGQLLSPDSTARLLGLMASSHTGVSRLRAGLAPGWTLAHKTGTGQVMGPLATGFNDVGILTAPDGRAYAVAVLIGSTRRSVEERQALMAEVARAVAATHEAPAMVAASPA